MNLSTLAPESGNRDSQEPSLKGVMFSIERSDVYQRWLDEKKCIEENKWYLSEQLGFDCGWSHAKWDWDMRFRKKWMKEWDENHRH